MLRAFAILLLGLLVALDGGQGPLIDGLQLLADAHAADGDDCCPDTDGQTDDDGDCCDVDFGRCCAGAATALASASTGQTRRPAPGMDQTVSVPAALFHNRPTGPPPTPPPIG